MEYHVAKTGNDGALGTKEQPFLTISRAAEVAMAGDTVIDEVKSYFGMRKYSMKRDGKGKVRIYEGRESDGDFARVKPSVHEGFTKIVDVTYKERVY